jgi:hypothetical protein
MIKFYKSSLIALALMSSAAFAKDSGHIITGSSSSSVNFSESTYGNGYDTDFNLGVGYDYAFSGGLQVGGFLGSSIFSGGSVWSLSVGPTYNFNADIESSFYAGAKLGVISYHFDRRNSDEDTFAMVEFGKRFKLMENVSYSPAINVSKNLESNSADPSFSLALFQLSVIF